MTSRGAALGTARSASAWLVLAAALGTLWSPSPAGLEGGRGTLQTPLMTVPQPRLAGADPGVAQALSLARRSLDVLVARGDLTPAELATAYGDTGLLYHAHLAFAAAEACYRNAADLAPDERRWAYYLGYLYQQNGRLAEAVQAYEQALIVDPGFALAHWRLGEALLDQGLLEASRRHLRIAAETADTRAAALFALGRLALATRDYGTAIRDLSEALRLAPRASRIHLTLAMAYRGQGNLSQARSHMEKRGDVSPAVVDPLITAMEQRSTGQRTLFHHAISAVNRGEYALAAEGFRSGLSLDPGNANARVSLARALYLTGDVESTRRELSEVLHGNPDHVLANFLSGVLALESQQVATAEGFFNAALAGEPRHAGTRYYMGTLRLRAGAYAEAVRHYEVALEQIPDHGLAQLGEVLALIRSGGAHAAVRARLERAVSTHPDKSIFAYLLARLLAASPQGKVRDPPRAVALAERLYNNDPQTEHAEVLAMAYAATGRYPEAVKLQEDALAAAAFFNPRLVSRLESGLARYWLNQPSPGPWIGNDPHVGAPPMSPVLAFRDYPTETPY